MIALIPTNTDRAIEAVARLQAETRPAATESTARTKISELTRRGHQLAKEFRKVAHSAGDPERSMLRGCVDDVARDLSRILGEFTT